MREFAPSETSKTTLFGAIIALALWGICGNVLFPPQQHRLLALSPAVPTIILALNSSVLYLGIAGGSALGSVVLMHSSVGALAAGIPVAQWITEIRELIRVTRPGGWIEILEGGALFTNEGPLTRQWLSLLTPLGQMAGIDFSAAANLGTFVQQAGLPCTTQQIATPLGAWGGRIGSMLQSDILALFESLASRFVQLGICRQSDIEALRSVSGPRSMAALAAGDIC